MNVFAADATLPRLRAVMEASDGGKMRHEDIR